MVETGNGNSASRPTTISSWEAEIPSMIRVSSGASRNSGGSRNQASAQLHTARFSLASDTATSFINEDRQPWLHQKGPSWSARRIWVAKVLLSGYTEAVLTFVILFNFGLIIFETDQEAKCYPKFDSNLGECPTSHKNISGLGLANDALLAIYTIEAIICIYVLRREYFKSKSRLFDFILCVGSWLIKVIPEDNGVNISWLRIFRIVRIVKTTQLARNIDALNMLISGFQGCMKAMFFGVLILSGLLCTFAILAVQFVHPTNSQIEYASCDYCRKGFQSVSYSMLTLYQQIVAGDSWGMISIPVVENTRWGLILPLFQLVIGLGAMNLILAVIVEHAMEARETNRAATAQKKAETHIQRKLQLLDLVRKMDGDNSGGVDRDEILHGVGTNRELQTRLALAGLRQEELEEIIDALQSPTAHTVSYLSLCNVLDDIDAADKRKTAVLTKVILSGMCRDFNKRFDQQRDELKDINRLLTQLLAAHSEASSVINVEGLHAPTQADAVKQNRESAPAAWTTYQHNCPHGISNDAFDFSSGASIMDTIQSCQAEIDRERSRVRQSLTLLDTKWRASLRALEETSLACAESAEPPWFNAGFLDHATRMHRTLEHRRHNLYKNFIDALEEDLSFWVSQCSFLGAKDNLCAVHEQHLCEELSHAPRSRQKLLLL